MQVLSAFEGREREVVELFRATFAASEGEEEGALIGDLVRDQLAGTADRDLHVFLAEVDGQIVGGAVFTRLTYDSDARTVFVLGPVAVAAGRQGQGIGTALLRHGLGALRQAGVDIAVTYGDPNYYARVGFSPIGEDLAAAPFRLRYPEGWLAQSLTGAALTPLKGPSHCVAALSNPVFW